MSDYPKVIGPRPEDDPALAQLLEELRSRYNGAISGVLMYGSCLRSGDIYDGLLDLYLVCDSYRASYGPGRLATANWLLPPNVFYAETQNDDKVLRSKVTKISLADFRRGCSTNWFSSYIWGRFAQPTLILYSRDSETKYLLESSLLEAARTLLRRSVPALPSRGSVNELWKRSLALSYATELRTERGDRASELATHATSFYQAMARLHADSLGFDFKVYEAQGELHYESHIPSLLRGRAHFAWAVRRVQGKLLSICRLLKALFTFEGGLDYIAWKLERHSGEKIVIPDKVRRRPLFFIWGFFWGLYRRGIFK